MILNNLQKGDNMNKPRARELGLDFPGVTGPNNSLTDIDGVLVGHTTLINDEPASGGLPIRTGVTVILPDGRNPEPKPSGPDSSV